MDRLGRMQEERRRAGRWPGSPRPCAAPGRSCPCRCTPRLPLQAGEQLDGAVEAPRRAARSAPRPPPPRWLSTSARHVAGGAHAPAPFTRAGRRSAGRPAPRRSATSSLEQALGARRVELGGGVREGLLRVRGGPRGRGRRRRPRRRPGPAARRYSPGAAGLLAAARQLQGMGDVEDHLDAVALHHGEGAHVDDQVVVAEAGAALGDADPLVAGRARLVDQLAPCRRGP